LHILSPTQQTMERSAGKYLLNITQSIFQMYCSLIDYNKNASSRTSNETAINTVIISNTVQLAWAAQKYAGNSKSRKLGFGEVHFRMLLHEPMSVEKKAERYTITERAIYV